VIGIPNVRWNTDNRGRTTTYAGLQATAADFAKYGYLYLNRGKWADKQVVPAEWVDRTTQTDKPCEIWNQYLWHVNLPYRLGKQDPACGMTEASFCDPTDIANLPPEAFSALGVNGQLILVVPSADLVVVRFGNDMPGIERWDEYARGLLEGILDAIK
jgi:CubicO group peptidase (beta-lactamase class C family)